MTLSGYSQYNIDYGFSVGASNYLGEFGGGDGDGRAFVADLEFSYTRWTAGAFFRYKLSPKIATKISLNYIRLSGDDVKSGNPSRRARNLNFKNDMFEFLINGEYYIYKVNDVGGTGRYTTDFNLYLFGGLGLFYSNPKGQTITGEWVSLKPLETEGVSYSSLNFAIPLGIGFYYTIQRKYRLGLEIGWRTTFTDYIDDASTVYANGIGGVGNNTDQKLLDEINAEGGEPQLVAGNYEAGDIRGDPDNNDAYMTATVNFSWAIRGRSKFYKAKHSFVLGRKKRRRRKSRAKF
ncbi:MAG: hypothetical protein COB15_00215 [Flavobacteriales bacterium]|nr:MAG: hypothetical protein COB15_00215 [Flavobacteriales bacterium]